METVSNALKAQILNQALPYIQKYHDKIVVVKYGGNAMTSEELKNAVMSDLVLLNLVGIKVVLVHGGGPEISEMLKKVGIESKFIGGLRYTDADTAEIVRMVLAGKVNKSLVAHLERQGGSAIGLCGSDGGMIQVKKLPVKSTSGTSAKSPASTSSPSPTPSKTGSSRSSRPSPPTRTARSTTSTPTPLPRRSQQPSTPKTSS